MDSTENHLVTVRTALLNTGRLSFGFQQAEEV
jgi:hypothetical protein